MSQMPTSSATARTPPSGWRIKRTPAITLITPITASEPRFWVCELSAAISSMIPSARMKIPKITASVDRLLLGLAITIAPATMLTMPTSSASHHPHVTSRTSAGLREVPDMSTSVSPDAAAACGAREY